MRCKSVPTVTIRGALSVNKQAMLTVFQEISGCAAANSGETAEGSQKVVKFNNSHQSGNCVCVGGGAIGDGQTTTK